MTPGTTSPRSLPTLAFDGLALDFPVVQAALSGHSDWPMRMLARQFGASYSLHEVMLERFVREIGRRGLSRRSVTADLDAHPVGAQLMGSAPEDFAPAAKRLVEFGFDVIDINFGCPVRTAIGACRGGYHLGQPADALRIVETVRDAVPATTPVTVKMRRGIDGTTESRDKFFEILHGAYERGAAAVTLHGRTVDQKYNGPSDWSFLREAKALVGSNTLLGSGDLFTPQACMQMFADTGVDGLTVARGAIGNPWIFAQCRALAAGKPMPAAPDVHEQRDVLLAHRAMSEQAYGAVRCGPYLRRFAVKCARLHPEHATVRNDFGRAGSPDQWTTVLNTWYADNRPGQYPPSVKD